MSRVVLHATVSVDGFISHPSDGIAGLFDWYRGGAVDAGYGDTERRFTMSAASARYVTETAAAAGACVIGRRLFDLTNGWNGRPAAGDAVFVVTHRPPLDWPFPDAPFTFVTTGVKDAIEQALRVAGDRDVGVSAGEVGAQALAAGLIDEIRLDIAPIVLGTGSRFFGKTDMPTRYLENPTVIEGDRVTHLRYQLHPSTRSTTTSPKGTGR
jgi:dihydrofolate reductase